MRILQLITRPQRRGAEIFALALCDELERQGHATSVVALYRPESGGALPLRPRDHCLGGNPQSLLERIPGFQPSLLGGLSARVRTFAPDVVQVNGSRSVKYGSLLRRVWRRAPWALVYRSIGDPSDWLRGPLHRFLYRHLVVAPIDGLVAVSRLTLASLERCYRPTIPTAVLPRAIDPRPFEQPVDGADVRRRLGAGTDAPVLLFAGRLSPEKRPDRLLRVASLVARRRAATGEPPPELWIAGTGPLAGETAAAAGDAAFTVRMLGEREDVPILMAAADVFLLTSDTEGTPGVLLEAA
ncbi:MAG: glycosyltransferase family 4 protein, partial [Acidobacteriota bacterium]